MKTERYTKRMERAIKKVDNRVNSTSPLEAKKHTKFIKDVCNKYNVSENNLLIIMGLNEDTK